MKNLQIVWNRVFLYALHAGRMMKFKGIIFDLDGTIYRGNEPVEDAADFVARMRSNNIKCLFVTNRANRTHEEIQKQLNEMGIYAGEEEIFTAGDATAEYLKPGTVFLIGEDGIRSALLRKGFTFTEQNPDYVIVSFDRYFDYAKLKKAALLIQNGGKFIASNPDKALSTEEGLIPGTGAIVTAISAATGVSPLIIGKPEPLIFRMALKILKLKAKEVIALGDNIETDIPAAIRTGITAILILTGVPFNRSRNNRYKPQHIVKNYSELTRLIEEKYFK